MEGLKPACAIWGQTVSNVSLSANVLLLILQTQDEMGLNAVKGLSVNLSTQKKGLEKSASAVAWCVECP